MGLEENTLTDRQQHYLDWLCTPAPERQPPSKNKYCQQFHVDEKTVRRWEKLAHFREQWQQRVDQTVGSPERTQNLLDKLYADAMGGDVKAAQLYFSVTGKMAPQQVQVTSKKVASELSDDELDALIADRAVSEKRLRAV